MRYEKGRKETTRRHIVEVASRKFRQGGISATGLAGVMEQAGLTIGAFSGHFESKEELVREALAFALGQQADKMQQTVASAGLEGWIAEYLGQDHANHADEGCPSAATLPEIGRLPESTQATYQQGLLQTTESIREHLPEGSAITPDQSVALFALMTGTMQIARAMPDAKSAENVLKAGVAAARLLVGLPEAKVAGKPAKSPVAKQAASGARR